MGTTLSPGGFGHDPLTFAVFALCVWGRWNETKTDLKDDMLPSHIFAVCGALSEYMTIRTFILFPNQPKLQVCKTRRVPVRDCASVRVRACVCCTPGMGAAGYTDGDEGTREGAGTAGLMGGRWGGASQGRAQGFAGREPATAYWLAHFVWIALTATASPLPPSFARGPLFLATAGLRPTAKRTQHV